MLLIVNPSLVQAHCSGVQAQLQNNGYLCNKYHYVFIVQSFFSRFSYKFAKEITAKTITPKKKQEISAPSALLSNSAVATLVRLSLCH